MITVLNEKKTFVYSLNIHNESKSYNNMLFVFIYLVTKQDKNDKIKYDATS